MMSRCRWLRDERSVLFLLTLLAGALRIIFLIFDNMPSDAAGHVVSALRILENPSLMANYDGNCSTLHKYAIAPFIFWGRDPVLASRLFTLIFGIFLIIPFYGTLKLLFDSRVALFSTFILAFYPLHIVQSSTITADAVYYFFLWSFLYFFFVYIKSKEHPLNLWVSAGLFNLASLLRFECWIFIPFLFLLLCPKGMKKALLFTSLSLIGPGFCLFMNRMIHHDLLYSFNAAARTAYAEITQAKIPCYDPRFWSWFHVLWGSAGPTLMAGGVGGIFLAIVSRRKWEFAVFFGILFFALTFNSYAARMWHHERYSIPLVLWLIPYAVYFFDRVFGILGPRWKVLLILFVFFSMAGFFWTSFRAMPNMLNFTLPEITELGAWLRKNVGPRENIIIDADPFHVYPANIMLRTGISPQRCLVLKNPIFGKRLFENKKNILNYLLLNRPRYLALNSEGQLQQKIFKFDLKEKKIVMDGIVFEIRLIKDLRHHGQYLVYEISYE